MSSLAVGVDVGGTRIKAGLVGTDGRVVLEAARDTPGRTAAPEVVEDAVVSVVEELQAAAPDPVVAVGVGAAGLVDHDRADEALTILADLHGKGDPNNDLVQLEIAEIKEQVHFERTEGAKSYLDLLKPGILRRVHLGASLQMWSQLSGMNIMM